MELDVQQQYHRVYRQDRQMVDSTYFPQYTKHLTTDNTSIYLNSPTNPQTLKISLHDHNPQVQLLPKTQHQYPKIAMSIMAVYGIMEMEVNQYLVVVTKAVIVGQVFRRVVFRVQKMEFLGLGVREYQVDRDCVKGVQRVLENQSLYFSFDYDLTRTFQGFAETGCKMSNYRDKFMYNSVWLSKFDQASAKEWITPFISGFISINFVQISASKSLELCLITRRDKRRQGIRYFTRGANLQGNTANTCQTQLILTAEQSQHQQYFSYVQLRGSLPFLWKQDPDLKIKPTLRINPDNDTNLQLAQKNFQQLQKQYGKCLLLNLIDKKGYQKTLGDYLTQLHQTLNPNPQQITLLWFDFHQQCKNMKYSNLSKLIDLIYANLCSYGYFRLQHSEETQDKKLLYCQVKKQKGIVRTNCMDCLDRTNVVQSVIGRRLVVKWLGKLGVMDVKGQVSAFQALPGNMEQVFRDIWSDNANAMSRLYSGTDAMKNDFTKYGKRTTAGALKDLKVGIQRYFLGNFYDSRKQDYIHLSLGQLKPRETQTHQIRHSKLTSLPFLLAALLTIPLIVHLSVNEYYGSDEESRVGLKAGLTVLTWGIFGKVCQGISGLIVRKPIQIYG